VKRASPSTGRLGAAAPAELARAYQEGGAAAISVLTEPFFFWGSAQDLEEARAAAGLPVLRKDFIVDGIQVLEAAAMGADAVLLIADALGRSELEEFLGRARELGLDSLVEAGRPDALERALEVGAETVGINARDLESLALSRSFQLEAARDLPQGVLAVAESGVRGPSDLEELLEAGYRAFLVGEHLVRAPDARAAVADLLARGREWLGRGRGSVRPRAGGEERRELDPGAR
jgi:indole-3-glycerol phosphate synthase